MHMSPHWNIVEHVVVFLILHSVHQKWWFVSYSQFVSSLFCEFPVLTHFYLLLQRSNFFWLFLVLLQETKNHQPSHVHLHSHSPVVHYASYCAAQIQLPVLPSSVASPTLHTDKTALRSEHEQLSIIIQLIGHVLGGGSENVDITQRQVKTTIHHNAHNSVRKFVSDSVFHFVQCVFDDLRILLRKVCRANHYQNDRTNKEVEEFQSA